MILQTQINPPCAKIVFQSEAMLRGPSGRKSSTHSACRPCDKASGLVSRMNLENRQKEEIQWEITVENAKRINRPTEDGLRELLSPDFRFAIQSYRARFFGFHVASQCCQRNSHLSRRWKNQQQSIKRDFSAMNIIEALQTSSIFMTV